MGGTGKTPTTLELAKFFSAQGLKTAILLRGYKRKSKGPLLVSRGDGPLIGVEEAGDEAFLYASLLKGVAVAVAERRCEGAKLLEKDFNPAVILLDDAFQHLQIERDFDIVLITPADLEDRLFPFGKLREPLSSLRRANFCLLSKAEIPNRRLEKLCRDLKKDFGYLKVIEYRLLTPEGYGFPFENLKGRNVGIVSALGDNKSFQKTVMMLATNYNFRIEKILSFPDHYDYEDVQLDPSLVWITTYKDLFKIKKKNVANILVMDRKIELPPQLLEVLKNLIK